MITKIEELELFDGLSRNPRFKAWVSGRLQDETKVLIQALDPDQLRRAQGRAALFTEVLALLAQAPAAFEAQSRKIS